MTAIEAEEILEEGGRLIKRPIYQTEDHNPASKSPTGRPSRPSGTTHRQDRDSTELPDVTEGEGPQKRTQRRRCLHPGQHPVHRAFPKHPEIIDAVRAGQHCESSIYLVLAHIA